MWPPIAVSWVANIERITFVPNGYLMKLQNFPVLYATQHGSSCHGLVYKYRHASPVPTIKIFQSIQGSALQFDAHTLFRTGKHTSTVGGEGECL